MPDVVAVPGGTLLSAALAFRSTLASFDPAELSGAHCALLADALGATEKACAAVRVMAAARAIECKAHEARGFCDGAAWMARQGGASIGQARQSLEAAAGLGDCPATKAALLSGEVSWAEARELTRAEAEAPGAEEALLDRARHGGLGELREAAREHILAATPPEELHERRRRARHFRHWRDSLGMVRISGALSPEVGLPFLQRLELAAERRRREAGKDERELFEAYAADALIAISQGAAVRRGDRAELVIVCDLGAWRRGHAHLGELCQLRGGGPLPVALAKELAKDAFLKAVLHDGANVRTVKHFGRHLPAELRTALELGAPPGFAGASCVDCGRRYGLEFDHADPIANGGPTALFNLEPRCWPDHRAKTERDRGAGLLGPGPPAFSGRRARAPSGSRREQTGADGSRRE